ncbi:hypothetical protein [Micromonospora siamensis]|uniref:Uncharacterized protein n=1 Tax=Micromonospora siamensis TaxID=299152 RepID=A0A1C5HIQ2_9ACTN|nr:hypothetical protein [Micromonospora siamensis]SCG45854.1 hypothetical protein GA0074704_1801 [Micromonospora siamensis]
MRTHRWLAAAALLLAVAHLVGLRFDAPILPAAGGLAWLAAAGYPLAAPGSASRPVRIGVAVALAALGVRELLGLPAHDAAGGSELRFLSAEQYLEQYAARAVEPWWSTACLAVAVVGVAVAVFALPPRAADRRRTAVTTAVGLIVAGAAVLGPRPVSPLYLVLAGAALVALLRAGALTVAAGLGLGAGAALIGPVPGLPLRPQPLPRSGDAFLEVGLSYAPPPGPLLPEEEVVAILCLVAVALVLTGVRGWSTGRRAHGAAGPES